jgi:hypothetical protein
VAETQNTIRQIFDEDYLSLSRVLRSLNTAYDLVVSELLRTDEANQSAVYKNALAQVKKSIYEAESACIEAQKGLVVPDFLQDEQDLF